MESSLELIDALMRSVLEGLLNGLWQGVLIGAMVWLGLRFAGRTSATTRHAVWFVCLLAIAMLPVLPELSMARGGGRRVPGPEIPAEMGVVMPGEAVVRGPGGPVVEVEEVAENVGRGRNARLGAFAAESIRLPAVSGRMVEDSGRVSRYEEMMKGRLPAAMACVWLAVALGLLARVLWSYSLLVGMRRGLGPLSGAGQEIVGQEIVWRMSAELGIGREVRLFESGEVSMPMTMGALRPVIVLPAGLAGSLTEAELRSVLAHELAHIRRWDYLANLVQRLIESVFWFNPVIWAVGRQLAVERELACDDWAVRTCGSRRYASCLARLVELLGEGRRLAAASGILFGKHVITRRVEMILNRDRNSTTAVSKSAIVYTIGLAAMFALVCSLFSPVIAVPAPVRQGKKAEKPKSRPAEAPRAPLAPAAPDAPAPAELPPPPAEAPASVPAPVVPSSPAEPAVAIAPADPLLLQEGKKKQEPAIPESEMLGVLIDIVKRDSDPAVRNEALRGIYRMRSEAAVNALIQLYDGMSDVKVKTDIVRYLGYNRGRKAMDKLIQIARNDSNPELRKAAIRSLNAPESGLYFNLAEGDFPRALVELNGFDGLNFDRKKFEEMTDRLKRIEIPRLREEMKEFQKQFEMELKRKDEEKKEKENKKPTE